MRAALLLVAVLGGCGPLSDAPGRVLLDVQMHPLARPLVVLAPDAARDELLVRVVVEDAGLLGTFIERTLRTQSAEAELGRPIALADVPNGANKVAQVQIVDDETVIYQGRSFPFALEPGEERTVLVVLLAPEGWLCDGPDCAPVCGDGFVRGDEQCDDDNSEDGDGCSSSCRHEEGFICLGPACRPVESVEIPAGPFVMGDGAADTPFQAIDLDSYSIDVHEVRVEEYRACMAAGICLPTPRDSGACTAHLDNRDVPVTCASAENAAAYCAWSGGRLCSRAEWERAARGEDAALYPWGDEPPTCEQAIVNQASVLTPTLGSTAGCGLGTPCVHPVGSRPEGASPEGVLDLIGNVVEHVADCRGPSALVPADGSPNVDCLHDPPQGFLMGGDCIALAGGPRTTLPAGFVPPTHVAQTAGIRCCR